MAQLKSILIQVLGRERYLRLVSRIYIRSFKWGWLRRNPSYRTHYFVRHFIESGATVLDIGANLGYYSTEFARLVGTAGKVIAVEPIPFYRSILQRNVRHFPQVEIWPYALGLEEGIISMGLPGTDRHRHGLMKVLSDKEKSQTSEVIEVPVKNPAALFAPLHPIHYIKCDIEGYEVPVIPAMKSLILQHLPVVQVETDGDNKNILHQMFSEMGFSLFYVGEHGLHPYPDPSQNLPGDLVAIPAQKLPKFQHLLRAI